MWPISWSDNKNIFDIGSSGEVKGNRNYNRNLACTCTWPGNVFIEAQISQFTEAGRHTPYYKTFPNTKLIMMQMLYGVQHWRSTATCAATLETM